VTNRRPIAANAAPSYAACDDSLTRLVRVIARQAAREAFALFKDALETSIAEAGTASGRQSSTEGSAAKAAGEILQSSKPSEQYLGVGEVAKRLNVSEKTVRRKIESGDLPAHRVGRLLRISERHLAACVARTRLPDGLNK
jgi:excisionase family DNA binding protein